MLASFLTRLHAGEIDFELNALSEANTLACFGRFYREVLNDPTGTSHGNIRAFMRDGWAGICFDGQALVSVDVSQ